jgi:translocation and assembly module TamB
VTVAPPEPPAAPTRRRRWKYPLTFFGAAFLASLALFAYMNTTSFQSLVRRRLVAEVERITGGRVEIGSIHTTPFRLQVDVRDITVHGRESATDIPLAHVARIVARLKISSLLRSELAFDEVVLDQPVLHVAFYPSGATNFPARQAVRFDPGATVEQLFALSINRLELRHGHLLWDDQTIPLDFAARDTALQMDYSFLSSRYDGRLLLGFVDTKLLDYRPFAWTGSAGFTLSSNSAIFTSLKWNSGHSHLSGNGQITDFRRPHIQGSYDAQLDLTEAASIARRHDLRSGILELKGHGDWSLDQFASAGLLTLHDFAWQDNQIAFSKAALNTGYSVTDQELKLSKLQGKIFGGSFTGDAEWEHWLALDQRLSPAAKKTFETATISAAPPVNKSRQKTAPKPPVPKPPSVQSAFIALKLHDLSADDLLAALGDRTQPLRLLHPAASTSGSVDTRWKGTRHDAEVQFALDVSPTWGQPPSAVRRAQPGSAPPQLPLTGHAAGTYYAATDTLDLPQFTLVTPTSRIQASGSLSAKSALHLSISTYSVADWLPFISAVRGPAIFPVTLNGRATFTGNMTGSLSSPQLAGTLSIDDFDLNLPATADTHAFHTHWDSLSAALQLSFDAIALRNTKLNRDGTSAEFEASSTLDNGHITRDSAFSLRANLQHTDLADLQALADLNYPVTGQADVFVEASGTLADPRGHGRIHLNNASAYGETIQQFDSTFQLGQGEIAFDDIRLLHDDSVTEGSAAFTPSTHAFRLDLTANNFDLARVPQIHSNRLSIEGRADFVVKGSGTLSSPFITAQLHIRNLSLDREPVGDLELQAVTQGGDLNVTGNSHLQRGSLLVNGKVQLRDDYPASLSFQMDQLDLDALWRSYFRGQLTGHSAVGGTLALRGPLRHPSQWALDGNLTALSLDVDNVKLHNQDPIHFTLARESINIDQLHLLGQGTDFTAHGSVLLSGRRAVELAADGRIDLKLLSGFDPDFTSSGMVTMNMAVGGTLNEPLPHGRLRVENGAILYAGLPSGLSELNGSLVFSRERLLIETLTARIGGGTIDLKGDASYFNEQVNFNLTATGKDVRLRYPPGVSSTADAKLNWIGTRSRSTVSGGIFINKMSVTPGFDFGTYLERSRQVTNITTANSPLFNVKLDIHVQTAPELQMRTAVARLSGDADLRIRGSVARPAVLGRVDILEGRATVHGIHFTLERGDITFANPVAVEPQLNLQASTHVRNYDLNITLTGTPDHGLNVNYRSEPPLPKSDIIALLALGRSGDQSAQLQEQSGQSIFSDQASALILDQALNDTASSRFQRLFGASNIKIDPQGLTTETTPLGRGPQVSIEQQFANNLSLTYSTNVSQSSQQIIQGEYYVKGNLSVVGTRDQNGVVSFDLRIRRRKK